jgi:phosphotriesterase-related protein
MGHNNRNSRRAFLKRSLLFSAGMVGILKSAPAAEKRMQVMTVTGRINSSAMRNTLPHEHILVDFIGAEEVNPPRWDRDEVINKVLPYLQEAKDAGCHTLIDCTPNYLGRDVVLLKQLSEKSGLFIMTNTGYYGGSDHKFLPAHAFTETADQLASRWVQEWQNGIDGTPIRPGFMKISVNPSTLSEVSQKLIHAAGITHLKTGLPIASHTGPAVAAFEQIEILKTRKIDPAAFIWVHAQNESDHVQYVRAVREGAWVSLDGINTSNIQDYVQKVSYMKKEKCLHRLLLSHDAGWYDPGKTDGGEFRDFTALFKKLIPAMEQEGLLESEILELIQKNPSNAFAIGVRKLKKKRES